MSTQRTTGPTHAAHAAGPSTARRDDDLQSLDSASASSLSLHSTNTFVTAKSSLGENDQPDQQGALQKTMEEGTEEVEIREEATADDEWPPRRAEVGVEETTGIEVLWSAGRCIYGVVSAAFLAAGTFQLLAVQEALQCEIKGPSERAVSFFITSACIAALAVIEYPAHAYFVLAPKGREIEAARIRAKGKAVEEDEHTA
ncbi:hypothetical protein JCM10213_000701 [Rhodosporidiobolus nylandii]